MNKKILGMGNAVLDIVSSVSDDFLASSNLTKGAMTLVDQNVSDKILKEINPIKKRFWRVSRKYNGGNLTSRIKFIFLWKSQGR